MKWNTLHSGLHSKLILGQRSNTPLGFCTICQEPDHSAAQCAMSFFEPPSQQSSIPSEVIWSSHPRSQGGGPRGAQPGSVAFICTSWNNGACAFPQNCTYRHLCLACQGRHKLRDCPGASQSLDTQARKRPQVPASSSAPVR